MARKASPQELSAAVVALGIDESSANQQGWATTTCPACSSGGGSPSLRVNINTGAYRCFRCNAGSDDDGPTIYEFASNPRSPTVTRGNIGKSDIPPLSDDLVDRYHRFLVDSPSVVSDVERVRGWTEETIKSLKIGWDGSHMWIPVRDPRGHLVNARLYDPFKRARAKSYHYANADGLKRTTVWLPFGVESLEGHDSIWMFEGEPDGILAAQMGFPAMLITGGAGTWTDEVLPVIGSRKVVLCYDADAAGRRGAASIAQRLRAHDKQVIDLEMQLSSMELNDFTDAVLKDKRKSIWFRKIAKAMWDGNVEVEGEDPPIPVKLGGGVPNEPVAVKAHVLGSHTVPVLVPQTIEATCQMDWQPDRSCRGCPVQRANGLLRIAIDPESQELGVMCVTTAKQQPIEFRRLCGIPTRCPRAQFNDGGMWQVQHIKLIPPMSERHGGDSTVRSGMFVAPADGRPIHVRSNQLYEFTGRVVPDVITNEWTLLSSEATPAEDDIDSFVLDATTASGMADAFRPAEWTPEAIERVLSQEERSLARHVTKIYGRDALLRMIDLAYHSVISFKFRDSYVNRGWMSLLVIGDTRTGKSETIGALSRHFGAGKVVIDPANTTFAGLVGGLQQIGRGDKSWVITWGLIPTNDRGLVVIDETSSLPINDIAKMSGMRSAGIAEITKIRNASTPARTRLIMAGNPRGIARTLSSYGTPVEAVMDLIGTPEDVARFDAAVGVKLGLDKERASVELGDQPPPVPIELRRALIKFAWSRRAEHIEWETDAEREAVSAASDMVSKYHPSVPLVEPSEQDLKVARVAVAMAVRTFSVRSDDPNTVVVRPCHVQFARASIEMAYDGDLGYDRFSEYLGRMRLDKNAVLKAVMSVQKNVAKTCRALLSIRRVTPNSIGMALALDGSESRVFIANMAQNGAASFTQEDTRNTAMSWTPGFVSMLRDMEKNPPEVKGEDMF